MRKLELLEKRNLLSINFTPRLVHQSDVAGLIDTVSGDVDQDGDNDLLVLHRDGRVVDLYENVDGQGSFSAPRQIVNDSAESDSWHLSELELVDLDSDGDLDLIVSNVSLQWYRNDGRGSFLPGQTILEKSSAWAFDVGDIDGDETLDLIIGLTSGTFWAPNLDGDGNFSPLKTIVRGLASDLSLGDFDSDGDLDVLKVWRSSGREAEATWYKNLDGAGSFGTAVDLPINRQDLSAAFVDMDQDGDADVLASRNTFSGRVSWFENTDGLGALGPEQYIGGVRYHDVDKGLAIDLDGDGDLDLLEREKWYENRLDEGVFRGHRLPDGIYQTAPSMAADFNGDGEFDLLLSSDSNVAWRENVGGFTSFADARPINAVSMTGLRSVSTGDIDGDGHLDLATATRGDNKIAWYRNLDGLGNFGSQRLITADGRGTLAMHLADFDLDGDLDVISNYEQDGVAWQENLGLGQFGPRRRLAGETPTDLEIIDINGDGQPDVLGIGRDFVEWYRNSDGLGEYPRRIVDREGAQDGDIHVASGDIDGDGDVDLVIAESFGQFTWHENVDGLGNFVEHEVNNQLTAIRGLSIDDFDGDGAVDLLVGHRESVSLLSFAEDRSTFGEPVLVTSELTDDVFTMSRQDIDMDGDPDVVFGLFDGTLGWLENLGDRTFDVHRLTQPDRLGAGWWNAITFGDLDSDGDIDLVGAPLRADTISWYESDVASSNELNGDANNDGNVNFADFLLLSANFGKQSSLWQDGDFDRDGRITFADFLILSQNFNQSR